MAYDFENEIEGITSPKFDGGVIPLDSKIKDKLNPEQLENIEAIRKFLKSKDKYFNLIGKGGTGKTTIIAEALKNEHSIIGTAISHKATERLGDSINKCYTLAKALGMKMTYTKEGEVQFIVDKYATKKPKPIQRARIIVVDECSMITDSNMVDIEKLTRADAKVIYMGDFRQLPPIEKGREPDRDSRTFNFKKSQGKLTVRVRQGIGNPIIELSDVIAREIEDKTNNPYVILNHLHDNINKEGKGYSYIDQDYISDFVYDFRENDSTRFICFRNYKIKSQNKKIRDMIHDYPKDEYIKGELMIAKDSLFIDDRLVMKNSQEFFIGEIDKIEHFGIPCWSMRSSKLKGTVMVVAKEGRNAYKKKCDELITAAKKDRTKWKSYFEFAENFGKVDYGYAINTHKAQGSTYKNVYLDFNDILDVSKITSKEKCQSLYVGISRASDNLKLVDL